MNVDAEEPVTTMYLRDFSCCSAWVRECCIFCEILKFRWVRRDESNGGTIEVVGGDRCEKIKFRRVEGGGSNGGTIEVVGGGGCEIEL